MEVKVEGDKVVAGSFDDLAQSLEEPPTMLDIANKYQAVLSAIAPKRSGKLAASFKPRKQKANAVVSNPVKYAKIVNYGNPKRGIKPANFVARADTILRDDVVKLLEVGVDELIAKENLEP